jgi:hypothetical protein
MARRTTVSTPEAGVETGERFWVRMLSKLAVLVPPWLILAVMAAVAAVSHAVWGRQPEVTWVAIVATLATVGLTALTWAITHARRMLGRVHATATCAAACGWLTVATVTGLGPDVVAGALWWGGGFLAVSWNLRTVIRHLDPDHGGGDALGTLFNKAKEQAGLKGARARATQVTERKIKGILALPPGQATVTDAQRAIRKLESGMQVPPGTIALAADPDRADLAEITLSDPRVLRNPIPWPGPSRPGVSIAQPLRVGVWQDGDDGEFVLPGRHLQIMGMTGSGKSIGGCWNILGEVLTRTDTAVFAIDTSKDDQTLGPLRPGLARLDTDPAAAVALLRGVHARIPQRTRWLAQHGYSKWEPGCGLTYWVLWIEEAAKFMASDYTQMPTLLRGQLAKMCFGLASADDARWGLSTRQQKVDTVEPEAWEANYPGMAFLDAPGVSEKHAVMPLRTFDWGPDGRTVMAAHATTHAHTHRPVDQFTAELIDLPTTSSATGGTPDPDSDTEDDESFDVVNDVLTEAATMDADLADPDPTLTASIRPDTPIQHPTPEEDTALVGQEPPQRLSPAQARDAFYGWLAQRAAAGLLSFQASDDGLAALRHQTGMSRSWTYKVLRELLDTGRLTLDNGTYTITTHDPGSGHVAA